MWHFTFFAFYFVGECHIYILHPFFKWAFHCHALYIRGAAGTPQWQIRVLWQHRGVMSAPLWLHEGVVQAPFGVIYGDTKSYPYKTMWMNIIISSTTFSKPEKREQGCQWLFACVADRVRCALRHKALKQNMGAQWSRDNSGISVSPMYVVLF